MTGKPNKIKTFLHEIKTEIKRRIRRLRTARVEVYYHSRQGYLIIPSAVQKDSVAWLSIPPMETASAELSAEELGAKIRESLRRSKKAGFVDRKDVKDFNFWLMTGIPMALMRLPKTKDSAFCSPFPLPMKRSGRRF